MNSKPVVVIGDGWAALAAAGFLASSGIEVRWVGGTGTRMLTPLASLEWGPGVLVWNELASKLGVDCGEHRQGIFLREFRNKAFREPAWAKAPTPDLRLEVRDELLWAPERRLMGAFDSRFDLSLHEIEEKMRSALVAEKFPNLQKIENIPVKGFEKEGNQVVATLLGSGLKIECDQVIYADRWGVLPLLEGVPKPLSFLRKRDPMGVLQASFVHSTPILVGVRESFFAAMARESGEKIAGEKLAEKKLAEKKLGRHVWGCFSLDGQRSTWTLCLSPEEVEDNHEIAKKFRRLKSTLDKVFSSSGLLPAGIESFNSTLSEEHVRLAEELVFSEGSAESLVREPPQDSGIVFLTDGYGPSWAFHQVGAALGINPSSLEAQAEYVDAMSPSLL